MFDFTKDDEVKRHTERREFSGGRYQKSRLPYSPKDLLMDYKERFEYSTNFRGIADEFVRELEEEFKEQGRKVTIPTDSLGGLLDLMVDAEDPELFETYGPGEMYISLVKKPNITLIRILKNLLAST